MRLPVCIPRPVRALRADFSPLIHPVPRHRSASDRDGTEFGRGALLFDRGKQTNLLTKVVLDHDTFGGDG